MTEYCAAAREIEMCKSEHVESIREARSHRSMLQERLIRTLRESDAGTAIPSSDGQYVRLKERVVQLGVTPELLIRAVNEVDLSNTDPGALVEAVCQAIKNERRDTRWTLCHSGPPRDKNCVVHDGALCGGGTSIVAAAAEFTAADKVLKDETKIMRDKVKGLTAKMSSLQDPVQRFFSDRGMSSQKVTFHSDDGSPGVFYLRNKSYTKKARTSVEHIRTAVAAAVGALSGVASGMDDATLRSRLADRITTELDRCIPRTEGTRLSLDKGREPR